MENKQKTYTFTKVMTTEQEIEQIQNRTQSLYNLLDAWADAHSLFPIEFQKLLYEIHLKIDESERELHFLKKYQKEEKEHFEQLNHFIDYVKKSKRYKGGN